MSTATSLAFLIFGLAFVLSMLVAVMIKAIYWTVRFFTSLKEGRS